MSEIKTTDLKRILITNKNFYGNIIMPDALKTLFDKNNDLEKSKIAESIMPISSYISRYLPDISGQEIVFDNTIIPVRKNEFYQLDNNPSRNGILNYSPLIVRVPFVSSLPVYDSVPKNDPFTFPRAIADIESITICSLRRLDKSELKSLGFISLENALLELNNEEAYKSYGEITKDSIVSYYKIKKFDNDPSLKAIRGTFGMLDYYPK